jgi:hypothetical protein
MPRTGSSAIEDQLRAAVDAERRPLPPCGSVMGLAALPGWNALVDDAATLGAVANRRVRPPMIHVGARVGLGSHGQSGVAPRAECFRLTLPLA